MAKMNKLLATSVRDVLRVIPVSRLSANLKHLLLALFLCVGMIGMSGPGAGPQCAAKAQKACGCCPMEAGDTCCSAADEPLPAHVPMVPETRGQQQAFQAILSARPILLMLPVVLPADFPRNARQPSLSSAGSKAQALLCVRTV
jgi:hypothetical protein